MLASRRVSLSDLRKAAAVTPSMCLNSARALSGGLPVVVPYCLLRDTLVLTSETDLVLFLTNLLAVALAGQCFFHPLLLARLQVKRVTFYFFDNVFRLHFTLEPAKSVLKRFTFLNTNLCQGKYTSKPSLIGFISQDTSLRQRKVGELCSFLGECYVLPADAAL
jgi:hypothetical protein